MTRTGKLRLLVMYVTLVATLACAWREQWTAAILLMIALVIQIVDND